MELQPITYCTKMWEGDWGTCLHPKADKIYGNNMKPETVEKAQERYGEKFIYVGEGNPYEISERYAIEDNDGLLLWYASDVVPPREDWTLEAIPLLQKYPIVSPFWEGDYGAWIKKYQQPDLTDFGFLTPSFSDQAYLAYTQTMKDIDYSLEHPIGDTFPQKDSFERKVSMWLASTGQFRAVLKDYNYHHIDKRNK